MFPMGTPLCLLGPQIPHPPLPTTPTEWPSTSMEPAMASSLVVVPSTLGTASSMHNLANVMAVCAHRDMEPAVALVTVVDPSVPPVIAAMLIAI